MEALRTIIVDDNPYFLDSFTRLLKENNSIAIAGIAYRGEEAIELVRESKPDLVLIDISMPGMNGITTTYRIKKMECVKPKVVMISFYDTEYFRKIAKAVKAEGFVGKDEIVAKLFPTLKKIFPQYKIKDIN